MSNPADLENDFVRPDVVRVTPAALQYAVDFAAAITERGGQRWVVIFDWAQGMTVKDRENAPERDIGPCLILGALKHAEVPPGAIQTISGWEYAVCIPRSVWEASVERMIDIDESKLFKLTLR